MAKSSIQPASRYRLKVRKKRPGIHSKKKASGLKSSKNYKKKPKKVKQDNATTTVASIEPKRKNRKA